MPFPEGSTRPFTELFREVTQSEYAEIVLGLEKFSQGEKSPYSTLDELAGDLRVAVVLMGINFRDSEEAKQSDLRQTIALLDPYLLDCSAVVPDFLKLHTPHLDQLMAVALRVRPALSLQFYDYSFNNSIMVAQLSIQQLPKIKLDFECLAQAAELTDYRSGQTVAYDLSLPMSELPDALRLYLGVAAASIVAKLQEMAQEEDRLCGDL